MYVHVRVQRWQYMYIVHVQSESVISSANASIGDKGKVLSLRRDILYVFKSNYVYYREKCCGVCVSCR